MNLHVIKGVPRDVPLQVFRQTFCSSLKISLVVLWCGVCVCGGGVCVCGGGGGGDEGKNSGQCFVHSYLKYKGMVVLLEVVRK